MKKRRTETEKRVAKAARQSVRTVEKVFKAIAFWLMVLDAIDRVQQFVGWVSHWHD